MGRRALVVNDLRRERSALLFCHPGNDPYLRALLMEDVFTKASIYNTMARVRLHDIEFELFITEQDVNAAVDRLAGELRKKYDGKRPLFVGVLNGAFFFAAELMKRLDQRTDHRPACGRIGGYCGYRQYDTPHPRCTEGSSSGQCEHCNVTLQAGCI